MTAWAPAPPSSQRQGATFTPCFTQRSADRALFKDETVVRDSVLSQRHRQSTRNTMSPTAAAAALLLALLLALAGSAHGPRLVAHLVCVPASFIEAPADFCRPAHCQRPWAGANAPPPLVCWRCPPAFLGCFCAGVGTCLSYPNTKWEGNRLIEIEYVADAGGERCASCPCTLPMRPAVAHRPAVLTLAFPTGAQLPHSPAECCSLCQTTPKCEFWRFCGDKR